MIVPSIFFLSSLHRGFATLSAKPSSLQTHPALPVIGLGLISLAAVFAFAPPDTFDNLDSQSFCERVVNGEASLTASALGDALRDCTAKGYGNKTKPNAS